MKNLITLYLLLGIVTISYSQDVIYMRNGQRLKCKVVSFDKVKVSYTTEKILEEQFISKELIKKIIYENKSEILFDKEPNIVNTSESYYDEEDIYVFIENRFIGFNYYINGQNASKLEVQNELKRYPDIKRKFDTGHSGYVISEIVGGISGFIFGYQIANLLSNTSSQQSKVNQKALFLSGIFSITSLIGTTSGRSKIKNTTNEFNQKHNASIGFGATPSGIGLNLLF